MRAFLGCCQQIPSLNDRARSRAESTVPLHAGSDQFLAQPQFSPEPMTGPGQAYGCWAEDSCARLRYSSSLSPVPHHTPNPPPPPPSSLLCGCVAEFVKPRPWTRKSDGSERVDRRHCCAAPLRCGGAQPMAVAYHPARSLPWTFSWPGDKTRIKRPPLHISIRTVGPGSLPFWHPTPAAA